jgi:hypothetical protein
MTDAAARSLKDSKTATLKVDKALFPNFEGDERKGTIGLTLVR